MGPYPSILVRSMGRQLRRLPLWNGAARTLGAWLTVHGSAPIPEVFLNNRCEAVTTSGLSYVGAPSQARHFFLGASPGGVRPNQPLLSSVAVERVTLD